LRFGAASQCCATVPGLAAHPRDPAILHRFHRAIFRSCAGAVETGTPQDLRDQADEGGCGRRREIGGRNQDALCAVVQGLDDAGNHIHPRHSGAMRTIDPGISRSRVRFAPRNDGEKLRMTPITATAVTAPPKSRIDWTRPVLWLFAAFMILLIVLPM